MWNYEKRLQYPVNIKTPNAKLAQFISSQYGGPDGEIGASMRYLSQRFTAPNRMVAAVLNDVGTEELAHLEIVSTIVHQLTKDLCRRPRCSRVPRRCGLRLLQAFHLMPANSRVRVIRSRICLKIWQQNRRHAPPTIISSGW